jgi:hypothetical protein
VGDRIVVGLERLPTLEILGKEYPYDASSSSVIKKLEELSDNVKPELDSAVETCKEFTTTLFCGDPEPAQRIAEVYKDSALLWIDAILQMAQFITPTRARKVIDRITALKRAADKE